MARESLKKIKLPRRIGDRRPHPGILSGYFAWTGDHTCAKYNLVEIIDLGVVGKNWKVALPEAPDFSGV